MYFFRDSFLPRFPFIYLVLFDLSFFFKKKKHLIFLLLLFYHHICLILVRKFFITGKSFSFFSFILLFLFNFLVLSLSFQNTLPYFSTYFSCPLFHLASPLSPPSFSASTPTPSNFWLNSTPYAGRYQ